MRGGIRYRRSSGGYTGCGCTDKDISSGADALPWASRTYTCTPWLVSRVTTFHVENKNEKTSLLFPVLWLPKTATIL